jgi:hypothetical protein
MVPALQLTSLYRSFGSFKHDECITATHGIVIVRIILVSSCKHISLC